MWKFYYRLLRQLPALIRSSTSAIQNITASLLTFGSAAGPWLVQHGQGDLAVWASKVPGWWPGVPITALVLLGLLKANYALHAKVEGERGAVAVRLDERAQRQADADELATLRTRMRKRYLEWLKERNQGIDISFAPARAHALQNEVAAILEERYGIAVRDRFMTAADADSKNPHGVLMESQEYDGRIVRLGEIIMDIQQGRINRRVT